MAIYYLDVDDEITSAAARIRDSSDNRIALVLSGGSRVATSRINFRLLAREARRRNKRLAIITGDPSVQSVARSAELPVYASVGDYEKAEEVRARGLADGTRTDVSDALDDLALTVGPGSHAAAVGSGGAKGGAPARPRRVTGGPVVRTSGAASSFGMHVPKPAIAGISAILILVLAAAAFLFYPSATLVLTLREEPVRPITLSVRVDPGVSAPNDQAGTVPGLTKDFPMSVSGTFNATGQKIVETAATGTVTFTSLNNASSVTVPNGARVTTSGGTAFLTTAAVVIPKATTSPVNPFPTTPGKVDAPIQALTKGTTGNVAAGSIVKPPSNLPGDPQVFVTNKNLTTGGTHTVTPQIQQSDLDNAQNSLFSQMDSRFKAALAAPDAAPSGSTLLDASAHLGTATCNPDPAGLLNQDGASFDLTCTATGTATLADMTGVKALGERRVKAAVKTGYVLVESSVATELGRPIVQGSAVLVPVTVRAMQVPVVDPNVIRAGVKGKSLDEARAFASRYGTAEISVSPDWASTMPSFDFRIDIQLVAPTGSPPAGSPPAASQSQSPAASPSVSPAPSATAPPSP